MRYFSKFLTSKSVVYHRPKAINGENGRRTWSDTLVERVNLPRGQVARETVSAANAIKRKVSCHRSLPIAPDGTNKICEHWPRATIGRAGCPPGFDIYIYYTFIITFRYNKQRLYTHNNNSQYMICRTMTVGSVVREKYLTFRFVYKSYADGVKNHNNHYKLDTCP